MTPLAELLIARIRQSGPMTIADYMSECLLHPQHGYYATRKPIGAEGDFTTAPEISQMFGELVGLALVQSWVDQGKPSPFLLAELGPGRGTLMADILRAGQALPGFADAARVQLVEVSPSLRDVQKETLCGFSVSWHETLSHLPDGPLFLVANEFFDALPIRQFTRDANGWREHVIGVKEDSLELGLSAPLPLAELEQYWDETAPDDTIEICPSAPPILTEIANRLRRFGGASLIIDYGNWRSRGDTFQAIEAHKFADPLERPGFADLTAHVDFEALSRATDGVFVSKLTSQGVFLERLGITARAQALARGLRGNALENHIAAHRRLTHPKEMGSLFKVLGLTPAGVPPLAGLDQ